MSKLTQEEKRIRLAKAEGWTCPHGRNGVWPHRLDLSTVANVAVMHGVPPGQTQEVYGKWPNVHDNLKPAPDYFGDLNAVSVARNALLADSDAETGSTWAFIDRLVYIVKTDSMDCYRNGYMVLNATAAEQSEALGQALGLWKEGE